MPEPHHLAPFSEKEQQLYQPPYGGKLLWLYLQSHSLSHYPQLMTRGEGQNIDGLVN